LAALRSYLGNIRAPEFPPGLEWFNTPQPLTLAALRGKFVLLDFWTYGCINCIHVIPDLKRLEALYPDALVVIGVHSAKFANEGQAENLRRIIQRYELEHPVVNDPAFRVWQAYTVRAWPTTVLIDPRGRVIGMHSGEGVYDAFASQLAEAVAQAEREGTLSRAPLPLSLERASASDTPLRFPGKVLVDAASERLFISDSGRHRVVIATLDGQVRDVIGSGEPGLADGPFEGAQLHTPQGLALDGEALYIADTENHALRLADLRGRAVRTVVGDGVLAYHRSGALPVAQARLNSPWDLALLGRTLYIAMAGTHQLWALPLGGDTIAPFAGSGAEGLVDGPLALAALAQPSGLTTDGQQLYFADAEASAIRLAETGPRPQVRTLVGIGLFDFGDVDGVPPQARLQHALAVCYHEGALYVADTYNHKIKRLEQPSRRVTTLAGTGLPGWQDGSLTAARFYEPGGLSAAAEKLYVADTNNHAIRVVHLAAQQVSTLALQDPQGLLERGASAPTGVALSLPPQQVRPGRGRVILRLGLPPGHHLTAGAPSLLSWEESDGLVTLDGAREIALEGQRFPLSMPATFREGEGFWRGEVTLYYCARQGAVCQVYRARLALPLTVTPNAAHADLQVPIRIP